MRIEDLSNEDVLLMYTLIEDILGDMNEIILNKGVKHIVDSPVGKIALFMPLEADTIKTMRDGKRYQLLTSGVKKLAPIVEIISDSYPNLASEIHEILYPVNIEDGSSEEDM